MIKTLPALISAVPIHN